MKSRHIARALVAVGLICMVLNFLATMSNGYWKIADWKSACRVSILDRTCAVDLDKYGPETNTIGYVASPNGRIYPLYGKYLNYKLKHLKIHKPADLSDQMRIDKIHMAYMVDVDTGWRMELDEMVKNGNLVKLGDCKYALPENK